MTRMFRVYVWQAGMESYCAPLRQGTIVTGEELVEDWWRGENHEGVKGAFPANFVAVLPPLRATSGVRF